MTAIALPLSNQSIMKTPEAEGQQEVEVWGIYQKSTYLADEAYPHHIIYLKHFPDDTKSLIEILSGLAEEQPGGGDGGPGGPHGEAVLGLWQGGRGPQQPQDVHRVQGGQVLRQVDIQGVAVRYRVFRCLICRDCQRQEWKVHKLLHKELEHTRNILEYVK